MPIKYIPFIPEPIEGQAVLGNFNRILKYRGADDVSMTLQRGMPLYELEKQETVGKNADGNMVIRGECVSSCAYLKEQGIQMDLVYIDPPFASGADYAKKIYIRRNPKAVEAISQAEQELDIEELRAFEEKMYGDVWDKEKYLNWMYENLMAIKSVMSETASIYVHLDWHIGHYVKILLDEIFGEDHFRNEIIWYYDDKFATGGNSLDKNHDLIYLYSKGDGCVENPYLIPKDEVSKRALRQKVNGKTVDVRDEDGNKIMVEYSEKRIDDVWWIPRTISKNHSENYATQKPEEILKRVISHSSDPGMLVADFFGGSGTAAAAAHKLGRRFLHCDVSLNSIQTTRDRLKAAGAEFSVLEIKDGVQLYRNPVQTMEKIKSLIPGLKKTTSLSSFWAGAISDSKLGTVPVYVPNLLDSFSKLLDEVTVNRILHQEIPDLPFSVKKVIVYYIDIAGRKEIEAFIRENDSTAVELELRDLKEVLDDVVMGDYAEFHMEEARDSLYGGYALLIDKFLSDQVMREIREFNRKGQISSTKKKSFQPIVISEEGLELIEYMSVDCTASEGEWYSDSEVKIDKLGYVIGSDGKTKKFWDGTIRSEKYPLRLKIRNICGDETVWPVDDPLANMK